MVKAALIPTTDVKALLSLFESITDSRTGYALKYKTIFAIGMYTGLRVGEIVTLKYTDVFTGKQVKSALIVKRLKKRGKAVYSEIPISDRLKVYLNEYRKQYDDDTFSELNELAILNPYLFPGRNRGCITTTAVYKVFKKVFSTLKIDNASTHSMRRTALTNLKNLGVDMETIRQISGHESLNDLSKYLTTSEENIKTAIGKLKY